MQQNVQARQTRFRKAFWQRVYHPSGRSVPAFLVGCGRSGTSMLIWQLDKSWQINLYNENAPAAFDNFRLREPDVVENLVERSRAPVTLFKPILDTHQVQMLLSYFPACRVLFSFRHFDDVINSSLKKFGVNNRLDHVRRWMEDDFAELTTVSPPEETKAFIRDRWNPALGPEEGAALFWLFYNRLYYDLGLNGHERVRLVRYETLVSEPRQQFETIAEFLGLRFEERMVQGVFQSSIGRHPAPTMSAQIRADCEELYQQLCEDTKRQLAGTAKVSRSFAGV